MKKLLAFVLALLVLAGGMAFAEDVPAREIRDTVSAGGFRHVDAVVDISGTGGPGILLDASHLSPEELLYAQLLVQSFPHLRSATHYQLELNALREEYLPNSNIRLSFLDEGTDGFHVYLRLSWTGPDRNLAQGYDLLYESVFEANLDDAEEMLGAVRVLKSSLYDSITASPYMVQMYRAAAIYSPVMRVYSYTRYLDYYAFLEAAETRLADDPAAFLAEMKRVRGLLADSFGAVAMFAGSEEGIALNAPLADAFLSRLGTEAHTPADYSGLPVPAAREGLVVDSTVTYNLMAAGLGTLGVEYTADLDALAELVNDKYLKNSLVNMYGVYSVFHGFSDSLGMYIISYRDYLIRESFEAMEQADAAVAKMKVSPDDLDGYIAAASEYYAPAPAEDPLVDLSYAIDDIMAHLEGKDPQWRQHALDQLKTMTPEAIPDYASLYSVLAEKGVRSTAGSYKTLEENSDLYDVILNPFGIIPGKFDDVPEDHPHYEAVRFVTENNMMAASAGVFGVDRTAAKGDIAVAIACAGAGTVFPADQCVTTLISFDIMEAGTDPDAPLTAGAAVGYLNKYTLWATEMPYSYDVPDPDAVLTRGELAEIMMNWWKGLTE